MKELDKKLKRKIGALAILGILMLITCIPQIVAVTWTDEDPYNDSYRIVIDYDDATPYVDEEAFAVTHDDDKKVLLWVQEDGKVGIKQDTPLSTLHMKDDDPAIIFEPETSTGDTDFWMGVIEDAGNDDNDVFQIGDGTTVGTNPFVTLDTNGRLGIGDTSPDFKLEVTGSSGSGYFGVTSSSYLDLLLSGILDLFF